MSYFTYKNKQLHCESVPLARIAKQVGTPCYIYSYGALIEHYQAYDQAFAELDHLICFAMKSNSNLAILRAVAQQGGGADIVTGGELFRCHTARVPTDRIVFSGVGKADDEIAYALELGILMFNVESAEELAAIDRVAKRMKKVAPVSLRVNPDIDPKTHPYISTGLKKSKFGIPIKDAMKLYTTSRYKNIRFVGISCHIGSQITQLGPFEQTAERLASLVTRLRKQGVTIENIDIGGGLGITYDKEKPPHQTAYARVIKKHLGPLQTRIVMEPGRSIAGNAGVFVSKVLYNKGQGAKKFVVIDGAMNDLARPALYGSYHEIRTVRQTTARKSKVDVVGPICESGDFLAQNRALPAVKAGDLLAVMSAGAYGFTMASNYNSRPRVAEVLVHGRQYDIIRERESFKDLPRGEHVPKFLVSGRRPK